MKTIPLNMGFEAIVDDDDYDRLMQHKWCVTPIRNRKGNRYAQGHVPKNRNTTVLMHREVLNFPDSEVDHKNRNGLDNRKDNLRLATKSQQQANVEKRPNCKTSRFKGVWRSNKGGKWAARIKLNGKKIVLGFFCTEEEAAECYRAKARELFGEFFCP